MIQCKPVIIFNKLFNLRHIEKCWYKRNKITQSLNVGTYVSPRFKNITEIEDIEMFPISKIDGLVDDNLSQNTTTCYDEININEIEINQLFRDILETSEKNMSNNCVTHNTYIAICNFLYNNMKTMIKYRI